MPTKHALIIRNTAQRNQRSNPPSGQLAKSSGSPKSIEDVLREECGFVNFKIIPDGDASEIEKQITRLYGEAQAGDLTLLYISGPFGFRMAADGSIPFLIASNTLALDALSGVVQAKLIQRGIADSAACHHIVVIRGYLSNTISVDHDAGCLKAFVPTNPKGKAIAIRAAWHHYPNQIVGFGGSKPIYQEEDVAGHSSSLLTEKWFKTTMQEMERYLTPPQSFNFEISGANRPKATSYGDGCIIEVIISFFLLLVFIVIILLLVLR